MKGLEKHFVHMTTFIIQYIREMQGLRFFYSAINGIYKTY